MKDDSLTEPILQCIKIIRRNQATKPILSLINKKMSVEIGQIKCDRCDFKASTSVIWGRYAYELPDGIRINLNRRYGWCCDCKTIAPVEDLRYLDFSKDTGGTLSESLLEYESEIKRLGKGIIGRLGFNKGRIKYIEEKIKVVRDRHREITANNNLVKSRIGKPRCLKCSGRKISYLDLPEKEECTQQFIPTGFIHPGCNGQIMIGYFGFRIAMSFNEIHIYDSEGVYLRNEEISF